MQLKNSEKMLLILLAVVVIAYFGFTYAVFPTLDKQAELQLEYQSVKSDYDELKSSELTNNQIKEAVNQLRVKYDKLGEQLPPQIHQEEAILFLTGLALKNNLNVEKYQFDVEATNTVASDDPTDATPKAPVEQVLQEFQKMLNGDQDADLKKFQNKVYSENKKNESVTDKYKKDLKYLNVTIELSGAYKSFKTYLSSIESYKHKVIIKQISVSKKEDAQNEIVGSISISFPVYYDQEQLKPFDWKIEQWQNSKDPFDYKSFELTSTVSEYNPADSQGKSTIGTVSKPSTTDTQTTTKPNDTKYSTSDFYMALNPATSDTNTLSIGKSPFRYTALYADNDGVENATLKLRKMNGKYQYQYGTSLQTYPGDNEWNDFDLMTKGTIVLEVQSALRLPNADDAGVLLTVKNDTGLPLNIYIYGDDPTKPRLTVNKSSGKINIIKQ